MASTATTASTTEAAAAQAAAFTKKAAFEPEEVSMHRIRITLSSTNVKNLEKGVNDNAKGKKKKKKKSFFFFFSYLICFFLHDL
jgi:hypothetical protein